jgi:hypothetical protein
MISTNFFPNDPVPPVTSIDSCGQFTIRVPSNPLLPVKRPRKTQASYQGIASAMPDAYLLFSGKFLCSIV